MRLPTGLRSGSCLPGFMQFDLVYHTVVAVPVHLRVAVHTFRFPAARTRAVRFTFVPYVRFRVPFGLIRVCHGCLPVTFTTR